MRKTGMCIDCFTAYDARDEMCPECRSNRGIITPGGRYEHRIRAFLGVQPRRVTVTEEQARTIITAHQIIESQRMEIDALMRAADSHRETIAYHRAELDAVMAEINGEAGQ